ncbi:MAG: hypothetical protein OEY63_06185 [Gemmatimonadota bacterium]|nr:hypothetical protein [Gemmatimonadota bacterium]
MKIDTRAITLALFGVIVAGFVLMGAGLMMMDVGQENYFTLYVAPIGAFAMMVAAAAWALVWHGGGN